MSDSPVADPLKLARDLILRPSGLDDGRLDRVFGEVLAHSVDFADLYFQLAHQESWSLEDGIVKDGSASMERSEEHTSELQSPCNLVCRLLLEKKKIHSTLA